MNTIMKVAVTANSVAPPGNQNLSHIPIDARIADLTPANFADCGSR